MYPSGGVPDEVLANRLVAKEKTLSQWNRPRRFLVAFVGLVCAFALLPAGCPFGAAGTTLSGGSGSSETDASGGASESGGLTDTSGSSFGDTTETDGASGPPGTGALVVETLEGAINTYFDVYQLPGNRGIRSYQASNAVLHLAPGLYNFTQYFNASFQYATNVAIAAGDTTTITLGAIKLATVAGASDGHFDIYDQNGDVEYSSYNEPNALVTAPAGTFVLKEYFNADFDYATNVIVVAGETTTVQMGGIKLVTVEGAADGTYGIYDSSGQTRYASYNDPDIIITAPAGTFTLKEYFNPDFTYASNVEVVAGEVTEVEMGAIRYNGTLAYDIYVGGELVSSFNEPSLIITAPTGTYTLTEYFDDENVLATNVIVTAGAITDVP